MSDIFVLLNVFIVLYHAGMRPSAHTFVSRRRQAGF